MVAFLQHLDVGGTFNRSLILTVLLIAVSQFNFGFDQQGFNTTQAMTAFEKHFGTLDPKKGKYYLESWWLSLFTSLPYIGFGSGILIGSMVSKRWGRRMCMFTMSIWSLLATTIIITANNRNQILAGRILSYIYVGMEFAVVPIYQSEITPQKARGAVVATYQLSLGIGGLVVNGIARGTGTMAGPAAFRIIYGLFYLVPTIVICCIWFVPESPRWLVLRGRHEEALKALTRLREGKFTEEQIQAEMTNITQGIEREVEKGTFLDMFRGTQNTKRTLIVVFVNIFLQSTGSLFASVYGAYFVKKLGFINPYTITVSNAAIQLVAVILSMFMVDNLGRRNVIFIGGSIQTAALFAMGALGTISNPSTSIKGSIVAMMIVMTTGFSIGWAPASHILSAELPSARLRDITYRSASICNIIVQFAVTFSMPYLLNEPYAALGSKVGFIFGSIATLSLIFVFVCVPECKGRTLEEIDLLFESKIPLRHFGSADLSTMSFPVQADKLDDALTQHISHGSKKGGKASYVE